MKKENQSAWNGELRSRPTLTVIQGGGGNPKRTRWILTIVVTVAGLYVGYRTHLAIPSRDAVLQNELARLPEVYRSEGMLTYMEAKARLRLHVADELKANEESSTAGGIAAYLFPDLLPTWDFERVATESWQSLERAIESSPRTERSRAHFENLRAEIGIYEEVDRTGTSPVAKEVLKLYETLSSP